MVALVPCVARQPSPVLTLAELEAADPRAPAGGRERRFACPLPSYADKPRDAAHRSISLNVATGEWTCYRCGAGGRLRLCNGGTPARPPACGLAR